MSARYSFAVCVRCGVQSPPMITRDDNEQQVLTGWRIENYRFKIMATCPACLDAEKNSKAEGAA